MIYVHKMSPFVSTVNALSLLIMPLFKPGPNALHLLASVPRLTFTVNGEPTIGTPS